MQYLLLETDSNTSQPTPIPNPLLLFLLQSVKPTAEFLTAQHHISPETALKASSTISHLKNPNRTDSMLTCLKETGFSLPQIDQIINKYPRILNGYPNNVKKKLKIFEEKGFSMPDTIAIISKNPWVLPQSSKMRMGASIDVLKATLGSTDTVGRLLMRYSSFLKYDLSKTVIPNFEFMMKRSELSSSQMAECVVLFPRLFLLQPETIVDSTRRIDEMQLNWSSKMYIKALRVVCWFSDDELKLKMSFFQGLGFSENEVLQMFKRCPDVIGSVEKNIKETMKVLLGSGKADLSLFITNPESLMFSLEKRIKPRLEVVKALEERGLWPKKRYLSTILKMTNNKFLEMFVLSNSKALGDDCVVDFTKKSAPCSAI